MKTIFILFALFILISCVQNSNQLINTENTLTEKKDSVVIEPLNLTIILTSHGGGVYNIISYELTDRNLKVITKKFIEPAIVVYETEVSQELLSELSTIKFEVLDERTYYGQPIITSTGGFSIEVNLNDKEIVAVNTCYLAELGLMIEKINNVIPENHRRIHYPLGKLEKCSLCQYPGSAEAVPQSDLFKQAMPIIF